MRQKRLISTKFDTTLATFSLDPFLRPFVPEGLLSKNEVIFPRQLDYFSVINEREERFEVLVIARFRIVHPC